LPTAPGSPPYADSSRQETAPASVTTLIRCAQSQSAGALARLAPDRFGEPGADGGGQQPPRGDVGPLEQPREGERDGEAGRDAPVVADDEVPPEEPERLDVLHARVTAGSSAGRLRRSTRVSARESSPT